MGTIGLTSEAVASAILSEGNVSAAARLLGVPTTTLRDFMRRENLSPEGLPSAVVSKDQREWSDIPKLLSARGLKPEDFDITNVRVNEWGDQQQLRVDLRPKELSVQPARTEGWKPPKGAKSSKVKQGLIFFFGDQHVPHHDETLHSLACAMLREHKPEQLILVGDLLDYAAVSRWRKSGDEASLQDTIDAAWRVLRNYVEASPGTRVRFLDGNHEERLPNALKDKGLGQVSGLRRPGDSFPIMSTGHILRFDELGIEQVFPPDGCGYEQAEIRVLPNLAARHGGIIKKDSGASGMAMLKKLRRNIVIGDTHRQSLTYHVWWDIENKPHRLMAAETGTMAAVDHTGLKYASEPDWMMGFAVAQVVGDGFTMDLAVYENNCLLWRDYEYRNL